MLPLMGLGLKTQDNCFLYSISYVMLDFLALRLIPECFTPSKSWNLFIQMNVSDLCYFLSVSEPFPALPILQERVLLHCYYN